MNSRDGKMLGFREPVFYHANGKTYGRVSNDLKKLEAPGEKTRLVAVCVVSALSLAIATTAVVLNVVVTSNLSPVAEARQRPVCIPCNGVRGWTPKESDLGFLERLLLQLRKNKWNEGTGRKEEGNEEEEEEMCCAEDANQLADLLTKILDRKAEEEEDAGDIDHRTASGASYPPCDLTSSVSANGTACFLPSSLSLNPTAIAAHLVSMGTASSASAASADVPGSLDLLKWNLSSRRSFCRGLNCTSVHLLPTLAGIYFVYSQASFIFRSTSQPDESFTHSIKRYNTIHPNGGVDLIMQHSSNIRGYTSPPSAASSSSSNPITTDSSFLGGLVRIFSNDKVYVEVSHSRALRASQTATFFGMFKL